MKYFKNGEIVKLSDNLIDKENQEKMRFLKVQGERAYYLDEFKENVALALTEEQLESGVFYSDVFSKVDKSLVSLIKMKRDVSLKFLKPYIFEAEKRGIRYTLVDGLNLLGDIALVVVVNTPYDDNNRDIVLEDIATTFEKAGLYPELTQFFGKKICSKHYEMIEERLPQYASQFKKMSLFDRLLGASCPLEKLDKEKNKRW